ncbi:hypothetical protein WOA01_23910 [Methylocystis sp. IM2]|uniref:hypothetical protein n=1 Tax=unclassified Methylocystis TaxID=2625913 RepID=UPI0030FBD759
MTPATVAARDIHGRGWKPLPLEAKSKRPLASDWVNYTLNPANIETEFAGERMSA